MLTGRQETLIERSESKVSEHFDTIAQRMYDIMFERYPEIRPLFNESHMEAGTQQRALADAVLAYVQWRKQSDAVRREPATTVDKHVALNIPARAILNGRRKPDGGDRRAVGRRSPTI